MSDLFESSFEPLKHRLFDYQRLVIKVFDYVFMPLGIDLQDDGFDRRVAFDQNS